MEPIWSLGLMSGTSLDGVDAAWLRTDGQKIEDVGEGFTTPYPPSLRENIRSIFGVKGITEKVRAVERALTLFHAEVVQQALKQIGNQYPIGLIGFHGQTIFHAPPKSCQLGDGKLLAQEAGIDVIHDFRTKDLVHGGQGAPLVPVFHQAIAGGNTPVAVVNIGGVANMTWIQEGQPPIACDTGPGGALLDDWILCKTGQLYDKDGQLGMQGKANEACVAQWLTHSYFAKPAPKSLDRDHFLAFLKDIKEFSPADGAATLAELTTRGIVDSLLSLPSMPKKMYVAGGGRRNRFLMQHLQSLAPCPVDTVEALGWDGDLLEAYAFAYLAVRVKAGLPTSFPTTTGVARPVSGGLWARTNSNTSVSFSINIEN